MRRLAPLLLLLVSATAGADASIERRMYSDQVTSSTFLWNDWNKFQENYHPAYAMDGDPTTAWVEGAKGSGAGEWIRFDVTHLDGATGARLRIHNGYQKSASLFKANARIKQATVMLYPSGATQTVTLADSQDWQEIKVSQASGPIEAIQLKVDSVYAGSKYEDLCVSDVELYVTATTRDNPVAENARLTRLLTWKGARAAAAAAFKSAAKGQMPLATAYSLRAEAGDVDYSRAPEGAWGGTVPMLNLLSGLPADPTVPTPTAAITTAMDGINTNFAGWSAVQAVATDTRTIPTVDGMGPASLWNCYEGPPVWGDAETHQASGTLELPIGGKLGFLRSDGVGTFATQDAPTLADALEAKPAACSKATAEAPKIYAWASMAPATATSPARVQALLTVACGMVEAREGFERVATPQLLVYGDDGHLVLMAGRYYATAYGWKDNVLTAARRAGDVVVRATQTEAVASQ